MRVQWSCVTALLVAFFAAAVHAEDREHIRIVGSSTVYPFSCAVADEFEKKTRFQTAVVESTGSGGGHKLFGAGLGMTTPDITASSRKMKVSEFQRAQSNGVRNITEAVIGYDGIAIASKLSSPKVSLKLEHLALAAAAEVPDANGKLVKNSYKYWDEISSDLPHRKIKIFGPPRTSGTRDAFEELCMEVATSKRIKGYNGQKYSKVRRDGVWVDSGENDDLIVQKLTRNKDAIGVFGFSFLEKNRDKIQGARIDGVDPKFETISSGQYPLSRSLFFYIKTDHLRSMPGLYEYVKLFMDERMIGRDGYLTRIGLVPLPEHLREASRRRVLKLDPLTLQDGKLSELKDFATANGYAAR